jgi:hypothetical protein
MMVKSTKSRKTNRKLVVQALTDPKFRKQLKADPAKALGVKKLSEIQLKEVDLVLAMVRGIDRQIANLADELLCANGGGGCSIG